MCLIVVRPLILASLIFCPFVFTPMNYGSHNKNLHSKNYCPSFFYSCPRIIISHSYPYTWETNSCTGIDVGYHIARGCHSGKKTCERSFCFWTCMRNKNDNDDSTTITSTSSTTTTTARLHLYLYRTAPSV